MDYYQIIESMLTASEETIKLVTKDLKLSPKGRLCISNGKNGPRFMRESYRDGRRIRKGVARDKELLYNLAHKAYLEAYLENMQSFNEELKLFLDKLSLQGLSGNMLSNQGLSGNRLSNQGLSENKQSLPRVVENKQILPELSENIRKGKYFPDGQGNNRMYRFPLDPMDVIKSMHPNFRLLDPALILNPGLVNGMPAFPNPSQSVRPVQLRSDIGSISPEEWGCMPYCENLSHPEHKNHTTPKGFKARSKSEVSVLGLYDVRPLFYHYDETFLIGDEQISPDIIAVKNNGKLIIHEHFGLDNPQYNNRNKRKLWLYEKAGFRQGHNLILSYDKKDGSIDMRLIAAMIDSYFEL